MITEDDYFDYLIGVTSRNDLIPGVVRRSLTDSALLFLGFDLDDWDFRVLFRSIMNREGSKRRSKYAHVAAQIDPETEAHHRSRRAPSATWRPTSATPTSASSGAAWPTSAASWRQRLRHPADGQ